MASLHLCSQEWVDHFSHYLRTSFLRVSVSCSGGRRFPMVSSPWSIVPYFSGGSFSLASPMLYSIHSLIMRPIGPSFSMRWLPISPLHSGSFSNSSDTNSSHSCRFFSEFYELGRMECISENLGPFDQTNIVWISENIFSTNEKEVDERLESIEIKMIDVISILLIIYIGWTSDYERWIMQVISHECSYECTFPSTKISQEKYLLPRNKREKKFRNSIFWNISIYVNRIVIHILHEVSFCAMLMRVFIIPSYASQSCTNKCSAPE